jgi:hypothetical protein
MSANNFDLISDLLAPETRTLDLGGYTKSKAGQLLTVNVSASGVEEALTRKVIGQTFDEKGNIASVTYAEESISERWERIRKVVAILFDLPLDKVRQFNDDLLQWLFAEGMAVYRAYYAERHDFLANDSTPTTTT